MAEQRRGWELRLGIWATEEQAYALQEQVHRLLCPDREHAPPCPIPWEGGTQPIEGDEDGRYSALLEQAAIEYPEEAPDPPEPEAGRPGVSRRGGTDPTVRKADVGDVDAIAAFGSAVVPPHYEPILGDAAAQAQLSWWAPQRISSAVAAGRVHVAVAEGAIVGVSETGEMAGEQVIWKLYLAPDIRGRSLGVEMLRHAIAALPTGTDHVLVEHFAGNTRAGAFYEREGFMVVNTEPASSGDPNAAVVWRRLELRG